MPSTEQLAALAAFDRVIQESLTYLEGDAQNTTARIGIWGARDLLAHFYYWHYATAWGTASVSHGGPPWQVATLGPDGTNAASVELLAEDDVPTMIEDLRRIHRRFLRVATLAPDWDAIVFRRAEGAELSLATRIEGIGNHWRNHLEELKRLSAAEQQQEPANSN